MKEPLENKLQKEVCTFYGKIPLGMNDKKAKNMKSTKKCRRNYAKNIQFFVFKLKLI